MIPNTTMTAADIRRVLAAAADVLFADGVPEAFLDQWTDETAFLLEAGSAVRHRTDH